MRNSLSMTLIVLLALLTPVSAVAAWARLELDDSDRFVATMAPLSSDRDVRNAVTDQVTDEALRQLGPGPLRDAVRAPLHDAVHSFTTSGSFATVWKAVSRAVQSTTQQALEGDTDKSVTIDLAPVSRAVKRQLVADGVPFAGRIPVRHASITVLNPADLGVSREAVRGLQQAGIWPGVAALVAAVLAVLVAVRRRRAAILVGAAFAVGAVVLIVLITVGRGLSLDALPSDVDRSAGGAVYDALTGSLRTTSWIVLVCGLILAAASWLVGALRGRLY